MGEVASTFVSVAPSAQGFGGKLDKQIGGDLDSSGKRAGSRFGTALKVGAVGAIAGLAVGAKLGATFLKGAIGQASDLNESGTKLNAIFGKDGSAAVNKFARGSGQKLGQTKLEVLDAAATFGTFGKAAGKQGPGLAKFSSGLVGLSTDLASFYNTKPGEASEAIGAALRGEAEPIRKYGVLLDDATLKAEALRLGILKPVKDKDKILSAQTRVTTAQAAYNTALKKNGADSLITLKAQGALGSAQTALKKATAGTIPKLTQQQKVLAAQASIFRQTKDAQGDFTRTGGGLANQQRKLAGSLGNTSAVVGKSLLPATVGLVTFANTTLVPAVNRIADGFVKRVVPAVTVLAKKHLPAVRAAFRRAVDGIDFGKIGASIEGLHFGGLSKDAGGVGKSLGTIGTSLKGIDTASLKTALGQGVSDTASVFSVVVGFLADHINTLAKYMPLLITAFIAYKGAQALANLAAIAHLPIAVAQIGSNIALSSSQRALTAQMRLTTGVEKVGLVTRLRTTAATVASTIASTVAAGAAKVWAAGQWLLNAALTANPIGLVVLAIVALVAGLVIAYKKSDKFRAIVNAAFTVVKNVVGGVLGWLTRAVPAAFNKVLTVIRTVVDGVLGFVKKNWALLPLLLLGPLGLLLIPLVKNKDKIIALFRETWDKVSGAVRRGVSTVVGFVTRLPDRITGALGDIGGTLLGAGKDLIQGLIDGIVAKFKDLKGMLGKVTDLIPDWKGPPRKDAVLLRPAGQSIMGGLVGGITDGERDLQSTLRGVTNRIQVRAPRLEPSVSGATAGGVGGVTGRGGQEFRGTLGIDRDGVAYIRGVSRDAVRAGNVARQAAARNQATGGADFRT